MYIPSRFVKVVSPLAIAIALTACGGGSSFGGSGGTSNQGGGDTTNPDGGRPTDAVAVSSLELNAGSTQLLVDGSKPIQITAIAKDENNNVISNTEFDFTVDKNATLVVSGGTATLTPGSAEIGDELTVTVTSGGKTKSLTITVVKKDTEVVEGGVEVAAIDVRTESLKLFVDGSKPVKVTAITKNALNNIISADVAFSTTGNATLAVSGNTVTVTPHNAVIGETITITIKSGGKTETVDLLVTEKETEVEGGETVTAIDVSNDSTDNKLFVDGSKPVKITAIPKNENQNAISADVNFTTTDDVTLVVSGNSVTVTPDGVAVGDTVTITVKSGGITKNVVLTVTEQETVVEGGETITAIDVRTDTRKLFADGTNTVTITALPKNIKNNAINADVEFTSADKVTLIVSGSKVTVTADGAAVGDTVTITVKAGGVTKDIVLDVTEQETVVEGGETVANIDVRPDSLQLLVDGSKAISIVVTPKNSANNAIEADVKFTAEGPATLVVSGKTAVLTPDRAQVGDPVTVTIKAGGEERTLTFIVIAKEAEVEGGETVTGMDLQSDSTQLLADGSKTVKITAIPKNIDNNAISAEVKFSAQNAAVTIQTSGNTATVTSDGAAPNSSVTIKVVSGDVTKTVTLDVVDVAEEPVLSLSDMQIGIENLSAGGSTGLTIELKDQNGDYAKTSQTVSFTSKCISNGSSTIVSPITSDKGVFTTTYTSIGCEGEDVITAEVQGLGLKKTGTVNVTPANLGAVEFVSALPKNILLEGMSAPGQQHTSTVTFQIKNDVGGPIANADVAFELVTPSAGDGGIKLATLTGKTDNNGFVSTILQSGSVHTSVRVRATVDRNGTKISSESSELVISTGIADQNSLSLSLEMLNAPAWNHDGVKVKANIYAADRYNNPVPDGTTVSFYTELGQIEPSCTTVKGYCSAIWTSTNPRYLGVGADARYAQDGITTITAKVIGEESFLDTNANGVFDVGDVFDANSDRGEAYADYNMKYADGHGVFGNHYDQGLDRFILDYNGNGSYDGKDAKYTGLGCNHPTLCADDNGLKDIFTSTELVMSEDTQAIRVYDTSGNLVYDAQNGGTQLNPVLAGDPNYTGDKYYKLLNNRGYRIEVFGTTNRQVPPVNTTIAASSEAAKVITESAKVPSTNAHNTDPANPYGAFMLPLYLEAGEKPSGTVKIAINTGGLETTYVLPFENDNDGDGLANSQDWDDDNDGISDADEKASNGAFGSTNAFIPDPVNTDTDGDGTTDRDESTVGSFTITDTNDNGISDVKE